MDIKELGEIVGEGAFGVVKTAKCSDGKTYAIKLLSLKKCSGAIADEINTLRQIPEHKNIVRYYTYQRLDTDTIGLVLDFCEQGSLNDYVLKQGNTLSNKDLLSLFADISTGLAFLHANMILHRDLKTENILVTLENRQIVCKITDFGIAKMYPPDHTMTSIYTNKFVGTHYFAAPEVLKCTTKGVNFPFAADIFSLACVYLAIITMSEIEEGSNKKRVLAPFYKVKSGARHSLSAAIDFGQDIRKMSHDRLTEFVSENLASLIANMFDEDFRARPTAEEVCKTVKEIEMEEFLKLVDGIEKSFPFIIGHEKEIFVLSAASFSPVHESSAPKGKKKSSTELNLMTVDETEIDISELDDAYYV